jgi:hypothetical protein
MGLAAAALGWRASEWWSATPHEFWAAFEGWKALNVREEE